MLAITLAFVDCKVLLRSTDQLDGSLAMLLPCLVVLRPLVRQARGIVEALLEVRGQLTGFRLHG